MECNGNECICPSIGYPYSTHTHHQAVQNTAGMAMVYVRCIITGHLLSKGPQLLNHKELGCVLLLHECARSIPAQGWSTSVVLAGLREMVKWKMLSSLLDLPGTEKQFKGFIKGDQDL